MWKWNSRDFLQKLLFPGQTLVILLLIWGQSLLPVSASLRESQSVQSFLLLWLGPLSLHLVRKMAHFTEFAALGFSFALVFRKKKRGMLTALGASFFAAFLDETIQIFAPGRGPMISDVWLDTAGAAFGLVLFGLLRLIICRRRKRSQDVGTHD